MGMDAVLATDTPPQLEMTRTTAMCPSTARAISTTTMRGDTAVGMQQHLRTSCCKWMQQCAVESSPAGRPDASAGALVMRRFSMGRSLIEWPSPHSGVWVVLVGVLRVAARVVTSQRGG